MQPGPHLAEEWLRPFHGDQSRAIASPIQRPCDDNRESSQRNGLYALASRRSKLPSILVDDQNAIDVFRQMRDLGVRVLLDDFGTGYASLTYLKKFPISGLKIDKSFVCQLRVEIDDAAIVSSTIGLSTLLGLSVIAEGIEDRGTANLLARMGCKQGQGYFFGLPMPVVEFERKFLSAANNGKLTWALDKAG